MNILGVGFPELVMIFVIMLIVAGPKRMIQWAYTLGLYMGKLRNMWLEVVALVQEEINQAGVDVQLPKDLPTRQNLNTWAQNIAKDYTQGVEQELKKAKDVIDIPQNAFTPSKEKSSWMPSANKVVAKKEAQDNQPPLAGEVSADAKQPVVEGFGSWGQGASLHQPKPAVTNFGTWGEALHLKTTPEQKSGTDGNTSE